MSVYEINIDGLVGPTHNYSGLATGNVASEDNKGAVSNPREAALQGLQKMRMLRQMGMLQMVMPPQPRPFLPLLRTVGFSGIEDTAYYSPQLLSYVYSSSGMWAANAATMAPSIDARDGRVHFTPANLVSTAHRAIESFFTSVVLKRLFPTDAFAHHSPLPPNLLLSDEGAANHMRLSVYGQGIHVFVYGRDDVDMMQYTSQYPARQALQASQAVARRHQLDPQRTFFIQQNPAAIDAGVFHNDVIATSHDNLLLYHEDAFADPDAVRPLEALGVNAIMIPRERVPLIDAVKSYLFNCQIVSTENGMVMLAPVECEENPRVREMIDELVQSAHCPLAHAYYVDLRESMRNGGGPACLRLRAQLTEAEIAQVHPGAVLTPELYGALTDWVERHYRDRLTPADLADPQLALEVRAAYGELAGIMGLEGLYDPFD